MSDKVDIAVKRLREAAEMSQALYDKPLLVTYSGGKDSDTVLRLAQIAKIAKIPFEVQHSHTTADAPETVYHVRDKFRELELAGIKCEIDYHTQPDGTRTTMWNLIPRKLIPPTRLVRYCCDELKEGGGKDRMITTGVRWDESTARKSRGALEIISKRRKKSIFLNNDNDEDRRLFETCTMKGKRVSNPIIDWETNDVMDFLTGEKVKLCSLYSEGWKRVGCIGCPMAGKHRYAEFARYPTYKKAYIRAFDKMMEMRRLRGMPRGVEMDETGVDVFHWWMEDGILPGQTVLPGFEEDT